MMFVSLANRPSSRTRFGSNQPTDLAAKVAAFQSQVGTVFKTHGKDPHSPLASILSTYNAGIQPLVTGSLTGEPLQTEAEALIRSFYSALHTSGLVPTADADTIAQAACEKAPEEAARIVKKRTPAT